MRKLILLLMIVIAVFVTINRQKLYLRDPLATVTQGDVVQSNMQVYINYSNDVILEHTVSPVTLVIVQHDQHIGIPQQMRCLRFLGCLVDANPATLVQTMKGPVGTMNGKMVEFVDDDGKAWKVTLR